MNTTLNTTNFSNVVPYMGFTVEVATTVTVTRRSRRGTVLPSKRPVIAVSDAVEITVGIDPQQLVSRCVESVGNPALRTFIGTVMAERDVNRVLTMLPGESVRYARWPIDRLRSCAETVALRSTSSPTLRQILFVAALLAGVEVLLAPCVFYPATTRDVIRSIVRSSLQRLESDATEIASLLRTCLGWGNEDDMDEDTASALQSAVRSAATQLRRSLV